MMVIMDSGFCVMKGLIGMYDRGIYDSASTKKRIYCPPGIY